MFAAIFDYRGTIYLFLAIAVIALGAVWLRTRDQRTGLAAAVAVGLLLLFAFIDFFVRSETDTEQILRKTRVMADAVAAKDANLLFSHISERFKLGSVDKATFRQIGEKRMQDGEIQGIKVRDFQPVTFIPAKGDEPPTASVRFVGYVRGGSGDLEGARPYEVVAQYVRDADGQWRLLTFEVLDRGQPVSIPYLPGP